jgi:outer membrane lipoprotein-sorting protein
MGNRIRKRIKTGIILLLFAGTISAQAPADADKLLQQSDESRAAWDSYSVTTVIKNFDGDKLKEEAKFDVLNKGKEKTLVKFLNADEKGEFLLVVDDAMWIYMPDTKRPIRITPMQRLLGNASNGDVARTRYYGDYTAKLIRETSLYSTACYLLELNAKSDGATYQRIEYWISKAGSQPLQAEIYLSSGKHYKSIRYDKYITTGGKLLLAQLTITEQLLPGKKTIMLFSDYQPREIPERYFHKDYLEKIK